MKKKVVAIIAVSSIGLLLGGLVYLGVTSFPELLESEKTTKEKENKVAPIVRNTIIVENEKFVEEPEVEATASGYGFSDYIPSSLNEKQIEYIDLPSDFKINISVIEEVIDSPLSDYQAAFSNESSFEIISDSSTIETHEEPVIAEHTFYASHEEKEAAPIHVTKTRKAKSSYKNTVRSNEALVETSLIVVGAVDLISMILIRRRKHLFR